jgi:DNA-binding response OmpR family regulator
VIAIISTAITERAALASLCESKGWASIECESARASLRIIKRHRPHVLILRHRLVDGYSDDVFAQLVALQLLPEIRVIVLLEAGTPSITEVRQLALGADCVLRNPIRTDVLAAYIGKYLDRNIFSPNKAIRTGETAIPFCGAHLFTSQRTLHYETKAAALTPREVLLIEMLAQSEGILVTYEILYSEIIGRRFCGDTSNMRVLLGKLKASCELLGITLRKHVQVIPKSGYRYETGSFRRPDNG